MNVNEGEARRYMVDPKLAASGWIVTEARSNEGYEAIVELPTSDGPADYALADCGRLVAVIEAKRPARGSDAVIVQAERYARAIEAAETYGGEFGVPFAYATNGKNIWFRDLRSPQNLTRSVARFHTPAALQEKLAFDRGGAIRRLEQLAFADPRLRPYQREAIQATERAIGLGKPKMLVAMATGTGKTYTTVSLIYRLMASGMAKRVLFLVDRRALAAQAMQAFGAYQTPNNRRFSDEYEVYGQRFQQGDVDAEDGFDPKVLPNEYLTNPTGREAFVYVSTIQRMRINLFGLPSGPWGPGDEEPDAQQIDIPIHAFDLVVADECHRGYTSQEDSKWREVLDHFDGVQIGLTATPAAHTTAHFKEVVYRYPFERAVREGYLVDYDAHRVESEFRQKGLFLQEGDEVVRIDPTTGERNYDLLEDERELPAAQIEADWTSVDSNRKIVRAYLELARAHEAETGHFPKTLFFADNDLPNVSHADLLVRLLREEMGEGQDAVAKITGTVDRPLRLIKAFRNRPEPKVAVTVDLLSTGVDVRPLEFIVIVRSVKSRILFEQILGRGTRTCDGGEFHPPGLRGKTHFVVLDCTGVLEYFQERSAFTDQAPDKPTRSIAELVKAIADNQERDYNERCLVKRLQRMAKAVSREGRERFAAFLSSRPDLPQDIEPFAARLSQSLAERWSETIMLLSDPTFQDFLENYPRAPRVFLLDEHHEDDVTVTVLPGGARPEDYLAAFERYVRENPERLAEIEILLTRPEEFRLEHLQGLRRRLRAAPEEFTEERLRRAYGRPGADVLSMVRHAATGEPLLDRTERVDRAVDSVRAEFGPFSPEQEGWLGLIRAYLHENLLLDPSDFELPVFTQQGLTVRRLDEGFGGRLEELLARLNETIAA